MAVHGMRGSRAVLRMGTVGLLAALGLVGCNHHEPAKTEETGTGPANTAQSAKADVQLNQRFVDATVSDQPDQYLPDTTLTGKSVGKLYEEVRGRWDGITFLTKEGKSLAYSAILETELGQIEIELKPEVAPNHVRNFIALAQAGYYDGLVFERTRHDQSDAEPDARVELIEGGCPIGLGNENFGSIGYWMIPEFNGDIQHEVGSVGACRGEDPATGACRFYITLSKAPVLDGERTIFGKVKAGLDVVRRISTQPVVNAPEFPLGDRPEKPIVIRKVTIVAVPKT